MKWCEFWTAFLSDWLYLSKSDAMTDAQMSWRDLSLQTDCLSIKGYALARFRQNLSRCLRLKHRFQSSEWNSFQNMVVDSAATMPKLFSTAAQLYSFSSFSVQAKPFLGPFLITGNSLRWPQVGKVFTLWGDQDRIASTRQSLMYPLCQTCWTSRLLVIRIQSFGMFLVDMKLQCLAFDQVSHFCQ